MWFHGKLETRTSLVLSLSKVLPPQQERTLPTGTARVLSRNMRLLKCCGTRHGVAEAAYCAPPPLACGAPGCACIYKVGGHRGHVGNRTSNGPGLLMRRQHIGSKRRASSGGRWMA